MPKGLSQTSAPLVISFSVNEAVVNTFAQAQIDVQLNVLDREILVVTGVDLDVLPPDGRAGTDTRVRGSISSTSRSTIGDIGDTNVIASARDDIRAADFLDSGVGFSTKFGETPAIGMDYLNIIATNNFFAQIEGAGNGGTKGMTGRLYCYRAVADAATFAALVQSELLSA
tara:strand:- start:179 stop:691 length:513 start_codon:yes stop_codon:yes gene_type:complete